MTVKKQAMLTPADVAAMAGVNAKTVTRWAENGLLPPAVRTMGGHRRWIEADVRAALRKATGATYPPPQRPVKADDASVHRALGLDVAADTEELL